MIKKANIHPSLFHKRREGGHCWSNVLITCLPESVHVLPGECVGTTSRRKENINEAIVAAHESGRGHRVIFTQFEKCTYLKQISIFAKMLGLLWRIETCLVKTNQINTSSSTAVEEWRFRVLWQNPEK